MYLETLDIWEYPQELKSIVYNSEFNDIQYLNCKLNYAIVEICEKIEYSDDIDVANLNVDIYHRDLNRFIESGDSLAYLDKAVKTNDTFYGIVANAQADYLLDVYELALEIIQKAKELELKFWFDEIVNERIDDVYTVEGVKYKAKIISLDMTYKEIETWFPDFLQELADYVESNSEYSIIYDFEYSPFSMVILGDEL